MADPASAAIGAEQLAREFPGVRAVDGIDLAIEAGQVFGFLGANGSGKTTTIRMLTTLLRPSAGRAFVDGLDCSGTPPRCAAASAWRCRRRASTSCRPVASC